MPYIDIHTHDQATPEDVIKVVSVFPWDDVVFSEDPGLLYSAGIHPWYIDEVDVEDSLKKIRNWYDAGKIVAIGEAGLDALRGSDMQVQKDVFLEQVRISEEFGRPFIIHCVKAYNEILTLRKSTKAEQPWILHGFNSSVQMMKQMTGEGLYVSLGAVLLKSRKLQDVCREVPDGMLFLETDESEVCIKDVYNSAAEIRELSVETLKEVVYRNFNRINL